MTVSKPHQKAFSIHFIRGPVILHVKGQAKILFKKGTSSSQIIVSIYVFFRASETFNLLK